MELEMTGGHPLNFLNVLAWPLAHYWVYPVSSIEAVFERGVYVLNLWEISKNEELFLV